MSRYTLRALRAEDMPTVLRWRATCRAGLRTPFLLTDEMQAAWYRDVVCNRTAPHRYWAVVDRDRLDIPAGAVPEFVAMVGATDIEWENGLAQVSLLTAPDRRGQGIGAAAVALLLEEGFDRMGLKTIYGEVYECNGAGVLFWQGIAAHYRGYWTRLPNRKFWDGRWRDACYFSLDGDYWRGLSAEARTLPSGQREASLGERFGQLSDPRAVYRRGVES